MSANVWLIIGIVFFALAFIAMILAMVLFFRLDIRGVVRDLSGKSATIGIASIREETRKNERHRKKSIAKSDNTNNLSLKLKRIEEEQETELLDEGDETTTALLSEGDKSRTELLGKEIIHKEEVTELLSQENEEATELLSDEDEVTELLQGDENETTVLNSKKKVELTIKKTTRITHDRDNNG